MSVDRIPLQVQFETAEGLRSEYASNIRLGGIFVPTRDPIEVRTPVCVVLDLAYCGERLLLEGEVVNRVTPELADAGAVPGVAVQFELSLRELQEQLAAFGPFPDPLSEGAGPQGDPEKRAAPRTPADVPARLDAMDPAAAERAGPLAVRTRDLSVVGVMLEVDGDPQPVGAEVKVWIAHPTSGEQLEIDGRVARHVTDPQGRVTGIGVAFLPDPTEREAVIDHLQAVLSSEHSRRMGGIQGVLEAVDLPALIQNLSRAAEGGALTLMRGAEQGRIVMAAGRIYEVRLGAVTGMKALARLLAWSEGQFEFHLLTEPPHAEDPLHLDRAVLEALEHVNALDGASAYVDIASLTLQPAAADRDAHELGKLESSVLDLATAGMPFARILDETPEPDAAIYRALEDLLERGILQMG